MPSGQPVAPELQPVSHAPSVDGSAELRTREAVVQLLLAGGPLTAVALAEQIGFSPAAIRRHLDQLVAEGAIVSREASTLGRRGRGRPARTYLLTDVGRTRLPHAYDSLAVQALDGESLALEWVPLDEVAERDLHPGFAGTWAGHLAALSA